MGKELTSSPIPPISLQRLCTDCEHALSKRWLPYALASWNPTHEQSVVKPDAPWIQGFTREDFPEDKPTKNPWKIKVPKASDLKAYLRQQ